MFGKNCQSGIFVEPNLLKWEASCQGRPPNHVAVLAALMAIIIRKASTMLTAQDPLGSLEPSGLPICQPSQAVPK
jgi:hypothetical protein